MAGAGAEQSTRMMPPLMGRGCRHGASAGNRSRQDMRGTSVAGWGYLRRQRLALIVTAAIVVVNTGLAVTGPGPPVRRPSTIR